MWIKQLKLQRRLFWRKVPYLLLLLLFLLSQTLLRVVTTPEVEFIQYYPQRAANKLFVSIQAYLIDVGDDIQLVLLGIGEFGALPQPIEEELKGIAPYIPNNLTCGIKIKGKRNEIILPAVLHRTGTAFEGSKSSAGYVRYFGERAVLISCLLPYETQKYLRIRTLDGFSDGGTEVLSKIRVFADDFDSLYVTPKWFLSDSIEEKARNTSALCLTPVYNLSGTRWLTEWLFYHHFIQGFDHIHLYMLENGPKTTTTIHHLAQKYDWITVHDWNTVINEENVNGLHPFKGVGNGVAVSEGFEHGQRLVRTDCYLRNRGRRWIGFLDVDEFLYTPRGKSFQANVIPFCQSAPICQFNSVTVFPVATSNSEMFIRALSPLCEKKCVQQFNCGKFNYGREKYLIKASRTDTIPFTILAIHSVSDSHPFSNEFGHVLAPKSLGFVRHFTPTPYKQSGGIPTNSGKECPFSIEDLNQIHRLIQSDSTLHQMYMHDKDEEQFLKLYDAQNPKRFVE